MKHALSLSVALSLLAAPALAQVQPGDILLNVFGGGVSELQHYRPDGTLVVSADTGDGDLWEGVALTPSGLLLTSRRGSNGFNLFDSVTGAQVGSHDTPEITFVPSDVDAFSDGTLAVGDQSGEVELYTETGTHVLTIGTGDGITRAFGIHVDATDELWIGNIPSVGVDAGNVFHYSQAGALLGQFPTTFEIGDLVAAPDGTIWLADRNHGLVYHMDSTGATLGSFATVVAIPEFDGIALAADGTLYVSSGASPAVYHYDAAGNLLGQFPILGSNGAALFLRIPLASVGSKYCTANSNSTGAPADLGASGSSSSSAGDLVLTSQPVPNQPGIFFHGANQSQNPFGCSFMCATGNIVRGAVVGGTGNVATYAYDNSDSQHSLAGFIAATRNFQHWYRDPMGAGSCASGDTFNTSNALSISILP